MAADDTQIADPLAGMAGGLSGADPASDPAADPAAQRNPLDVLEELLKESQAKVGAPGGGLPGGGTGPVPAEPAGPTPEQLQAQAEMEERLRQQAVIDQQAIEERRAELEQIKNTPQYQARVQQDQEKADQQQTQQAAGQGFDIKQLEHTKI